MVDLGLAAKVRPCLVLSVPLQESDRSLVTVIPHTTAVRQSRFEIAVPARFLRLGAFDAQGIVTVPTVQSPRQDQGQHAVAALLHGAQHRQGAALWEHRAATISTQEI